MGHVKRTDRGDELLSHLWDNVLSQVGLGPSWSAVESRREVALWTTRVKLTRGRTYHAAGLMFTIRTKTSADLERGVQLELIWRSVAET